MDGILSIYQSFASTIHDIANDFAQGDSAAKGLITVGIFGVIGTLIAVLRNIPKKIFNLILGRLTISVQADCAWYNDSRDIFNVMCDFISKHQINRSLMIVSALIKKKPGQEMETNIKMGPHRPSSGVFFVGLRPFWFDFTEAKEQGSVPQTVSIRTIGRNPDDLWKAIKLKEGLNESWCNRRFYESKGDEWVVVSDIDGTMPLFLDDELKSEIDKKIDTFINRRDWYKKRGLSHKLLFVFYGEPGTGKSALVRYIADRLGYSIGSMTGVASMTALIRAASTLDIVVSIPEVDTQGLANNRGISNKENDEKPEDQDTDKHTDKKSVLSQTSELVQIFKDSFSLTETLNLFQGDIPINNSVTVMSTNDINAIDPALLRPGRCDLVIEVKRMKYKQVNAFYKHYFETNENLSPKFNDIYIRACDVMEAFMRNMDNETGFKDALSKHISGTPSICLETNQT